MLFKNMIFFLYFFNYSQKVFVNHFTYRILYNINKPYSKQNLHLKKKYNTAIIKVYIIINNNILLNPKIVFIY